MTQVAQQLLTEALRLPVGERGELIASLIDSLEIESDPGADAAWSDEITRRLKEIDDGQVELIDRSEARRQITNTGSSRH